MILFISRIKEERNSLRSVKWVRRVAGADINDVEPTLHISPYRNARVCVCVRAV